MKYLYWLGLAAIAALLIWSAMRYENRPDTSNLAQVANTQTSQIQTMDNGLKIEDIKVGEGAEAVAGKQVTVNYEGKLMNGTKFDSSYDRGTPFTFALGAGQVIAGWDQGVAGMKGGGKRRLIIPAELAYGSQAVGGVIPPNSTLDFTVELLGVK